MTDKQPIGAYTSIVWKDEPDQPIDGYYFSFSEEPDMDAYDNDDVPVDAYGVRDDAIFFYCDGEHALKSYMTAGMEDFVVLNYELEYQND